MAHPMTKIGTHASGGGLRLVSGAEDAPREQAVSAHGAAEAPPRDARRRIARENASASMLAPDDARWMYAQEVATRLEGGRAAILRPADRRELVEIAGKLGVREFDANLVIALVQDAARRGEDLVLHPDAALPSARRGVMREEGLAHGAPRGARTAGTAGPRLAGRAGAGLDAVSRVDADANEHATRRLQALLAMVPLRAEEARDRVIDKVIASVVLGAILLITLISLMGP
jgi:hypothetical protein